MGICILPGIPPMYNNNLYLQSYTTLVFSITTTSSFGSANAKSIKTDNIMITIFVVIKNNRIFTSTLLS
jgi:hypothetical protein